MASEKLLKLKPEKRIAIEQALLKEFTQYPVAESQVARIVKAAEISRGAFYNYFEDLPDAYRYLYQIALNNIHQGLRTEVKGHPTDDLKRVREFIQGAQNSPYYHLMQMHYRYNETYVQHALASLKTGSELQWARRTLVHDTIHGILIDPKTAQVRLHQLEVILNKLEE